ncbi:MAG: hypothetical protein JEY99_09030 [Spirochaetales bacterium]|nr:hypothetical protein [Spirochaetales bacterium]
MEAPPFRLVLDSGATSCRYVTYQEPSIPLSSGVLNGINYTEEGEGGILRLFSELKLLLQGGAAPDVIGIALAGAGRKDINRRVRRDLLKHLPENWGHLGLYFFHDGEAALWAALGDKPGIVVAAGTGSIASGRDPEGSPLRAGGWGRLAGDEGSAYWIGLRAVQVALRAFDGREEDTLLEKTLCDNIGLKETQELVAWVHLPERTKDEIAALAPLVEDAANRGDAPGLKIIDEAAYELAALALTLIKKGGFSSEVRVGTTGSVFRKNVRVFEGFKRYIKAQYPASDIQKPRGDNLQGAIELTESLLVEKDPRRIRSYSW